jgi:hypothetical protein
VAWDRLSHGIWMHEAARDDLEDLRSWQAALPPPVLFTHLTAARIRGWWTPPGIRHPIFATMQERVPRPRRAGLLPSRHPHPLPVDEVDGLWVTAPAETILEAARDLGVLDLVVLGDCALRRGEVTIAELERTAAQRRRGAPLLRRVIGMLDARSESPWESIMRVLHLAAEIPVTPQFTVRDPAGAFVARADLRIVGTRRLHEYDGAVHRDGPEHVRDLARDRRLLRAGWDRAGYTRVDLLADPTPIVFDADRALGRRFEPYRVEAWKLLVNDSLHGRRGRARALNRWFGPQSD